MYSSNTYHKKVLLGKGSKLTSKEAIKIFKPILKSAKHINNHFNKRAI